MPPRLAIAGAALVLAQCAVSPPGPDAFAFAVMGDTPYNAREEVAFEQMIERLNAEPLAFVVHVGDFTGGVCGDDLYERRRLQFGRSAHPLVYTPGDNEWVDCRGARRDPLERLSRLRAVFFSDGESLGARRIAMKVQDECVAPAGGACACPIYRENREWSVRGIRFVTLNYAGENNNVGYDAAGDAEARCRDEANRRWLARAFDASRAADTRALVVFAQANPWFRETRVFDPFIRQVSEGARALGKPVLFVHGDTHLYRVDQPFRDALGHPIANVSRLETYGSPFVGWVRVEVDASRPDPFTFDPRLEAVILPR